MPAKMKSFVFPAGTREARVPTEPHSARLVGPIRAKRLSTTGQLESVDHNRIPSSQMSTSSLLDQTKFSLTVCNFSPARVVRISPPLVLPVKRCSQPGSVLPDGICGSLLVWAVCAPERAYGLPHYSKTHVCDTKYLLTIQNSGHLLNQTTMLTLWLTSTLSRDAPDHKLLMSPLGCASYQKVNLTAVEEFLQEKCIQRTEKMTLIPPLEVFSNAVLRFSWPCHVGNIREEVYPN